MRQQQVTKSKDREEGCLLGLFSLTVGVAIAFVAVIIWVIIRITLKFT